MKSKRLERFTDILVYAMVLISIVAVIGFIIFVICICCIDNEYKLYIDYNGKAVNDDSLELEYDENYQIEINAGDSNYYYLQLSENQQKAYRMIHKTCSKLEDEQILARKSTGEETKYFIGKISGSNYGLNLYDIQATYIAFIYDNPSFYFLYRGYVYNEKNNQVSIIIKNQFVLEEDRNNVDLQIKNSLEKLKFFLQDKESERERAKEIYKFVIEQGKYAYDERGKALFDGYTVSIAGFLDANISTNAICQGYAYTYSYLCRYFGIDCLYVSSTAINHALNIVKIDGKWWHADTTFDDDDDVSGEKDFEYFMLTEKQYWEKNGYNDAQFDTSNAEDAINWLGNLPPLA